MQEEEVIIIGGIPENKYNEIVDIAFSYAVQSIAFTKDTLKATIPQRIGYITDGKIAEGIVNFFLEENGIVVNSEICKTSYEKIDHNDFLYDAVEYDVKCYKLNNQQTDVLIERDYISLPAAIIQRQFKNNTNTHVAKASAFIFVWHRQLKNIPLFQINVPDDVTYSMQELTKKYYGKKKEISTKDRMIINSFPARCSIKQNYYYQKKRKMKEKIFCHTEKKRYFLKWSDYF